MLKHKWFEKDGSIFCEAEKSKQNQDFRKAKEFKYHEAVAFNVGSEVAKHIVAMHNATVK